MSKKDRHLEIELDPERAKMWREAWDLLLTGAYTLRQICEELHNRGYVRRSGKPWIWEDTENGRQAFAGSYLSSHFHNAFYAGWVVSEAFNIKRGKVQGNWEPLVSDEEFNRGLAILAARDGNKSRQTRNPYLLTGLLYVRAEQ